VIQFAQSIRRVSDANLIQSSPVLFSVFLILCPVFSFCVYKLFVVVCSCLSLSIVVRSCDLRFWMHAYILKFFPFCTLRIQHPHRFAIKLCHSQNSIFDRCITVDRATSTDFWLQCPMHPMSLQVHNRNDATYRFDL